jgi:hypothetical protein
MNGPPAPGEGGEPRNDDVFQQPDHVKRNLLMGIVCGTVAFGLFLCGVAYAVLHLRMASLPGQLEARWAPPPKSATVRRDLFAVPGPTPSPVEVEQRALQGFGWVDRGQGLVRVPIDVAMDLVVKGAAQGGTP